MLPIYGAPDAKIHNTSQAHTQVNRRSPTAGQRLPGDSSEQAAQHPAAGSVFFINQGANMSVHRHLTPIQ